ncbi:MAG: MarR family winged helix-turn-helix transcriptional regulator [Sphingomonadales bacterium]
MEAAGSAVDGRQAGAVDGKDALRLWLRLLTCTNLIESRIRTLLRTRFDTTLPRFDMLAALDRAPRGLTMGELSHRLLVSQGNVTNVARRLEADGLIIKVPSPADRRSQIVSLTDRGREWFASLARQHEIWLADMFQSLEADDIESLTQAIATARQAVENSVKPGESG